MADNLIFPIGFDLEKAVTEAGKEWDSKYADKLEKLLAKHSVTVKLGFDTKKLDNLDDVKKRLAELKIEPLTPENKKAIKDLVRELKELARIMEKIQKFKGIELPELQAAKAAKMRKETAQADEKLRLSQERVRQAQERLILSQKRLEQQSKNTGKAFGEQGSYLSNLIKKMAVYASFSYVGNFLTNVREVTAQFELQRVSLGAIIQDQARANELFSEIKSFALKSPVSILDLTKYTKQLAAYKIGVDELFETTKKLTDVSVGLGVSMDRVVLAYGQTRATGHLRASEIRQFTEMGVPIVEELAAKLSKMNGELVTAAQVMDLVSKRGISFEMVKEVFDDMTSAGGIFYNMQEKQGNTLYGMWAKLGDAASVMYDEIGNTESVNKGMKTAIQTLTDMMRNWRDVTRYISYAGIAIAGLVVRNKILKVEMTKVVAIQQAYNTRIMQANALIASNSRLVRAQGVAMTLYANALRLASTTAAAFGTSLTAIKSALITTGWGALIVALGYVADKLLFTKTNAEKAAEAISKISEETTTETAKSVRNFEYLANKAVNAPKGSTEQKEALEELERTYSNILPKELLELEYLDKLDGKYGSLTNTIREYIAEQQQRKAIEEIGNVYGAEKQKYERSATEIFREEGWTEGEIARFWEKFYDTAKDKSKTLKDVVRESLVFAGRDAEKDFETIFSRLPENAGLTGRGGSMVKWAKNTFGGSIWNVDDVDMLRDAILEENKAIEQNEERTKAAESATNAFAEAQEKAAKRLKEVSFVSGVSGEAIDRDSYLGGQMLANFEIKDMTNILKDGFAQVGLAWDTEYGNFINHINKGTPELISSLNFDAIIDAIISALDNPDLTEAQRQFLENLLSVAQQSKKRYEEIVPADPIVRVAQTRFKQIAQSAGGFREQYNQYLMKAGEDMATYNKRLKDSLEDLKNRVKALLDTQKVIAKAGISAKKLYGVSAEELQKDIDETNKTISIIEKTLSEQSDYSKSKKKKGGSKSDPRLQTLQEIANKMAEVNKEYDELLKKEGQTKALADTQKLFASSFKQMEATAKKYGFKLPAFEVPQTIEDVQKWYKAIMDNIKRLNLKNADKVLIELGFKSDKAAIDKQQKEIERQLKNLQEKISRTKIAKEFYDKILSQVGDKTLALQITDSIYPESGKDLYTEIQDQIRRIFDTGDVLKNKKLKLRLDSVFDDENERINYRELDKVYAEFQNDIIKENRATAQKLIAEGQKTTAAQILNWEKELAKAKSYEEQRTDIINKAAEERAKIIKEVRDPKEQEKLLGLSREKESQDLAKVNFEEFTKSEDYVRIFENLDNVATSSLKHLREELQNVIDTNKDLSPENMKTLVKALGDIDDQIGERSPWETLVSSAKEYVDSIKNIKLAKQELAAAEAEYKAQEPQLTVDIETAKAEKETADSDVVEAQRQLLEIQNQLAVLRTQEMADSIILADLKDQEIAAENNLVSAKLRQNQAETNVTKAVQNQVNAQKKVANAQKKLNKNTDDAKKSQNNFLKSINDTKNKVEAVGSAMEALSSILGDLIKEGTDFGDAWIAVIQALETFQTIMQVVIILQEAFNIATESNPWMAVAAAVLAVTAALAGYISNQKVKKANKEIEKQQKLLDQLEYSYERLEKAADRLFGRDYVNNYNQQLKNLQAQQAAYLKQAEAERSKGKKKDKDKIKEYEEAARDTADKIKELQEDLVAHFTGSSRTDIGRQMAQSWIDARASMSDTFAAIKGDYQDMIKNMIVEGAAARVIENALTPVWDSMEAMLAKNDVQGAIDSLIGGMDSALNAANNGMEVLWKALEARGYDMKQLLGDTDSEYTGIAKSIAGATSEEINSAAAIGNTLMYYVSPIPRIDENLARVVTIMEGRSTSAIPQTTSAGWTDWQQQAMDNYNAIARNTADTVIECRRAADACEKIASAFKIKGSTKGLNVFLNS
jgi:molybdopterin converting factor small subunit